MIYEVWSKSDKHDRCNKVCLTKEDAMVKIAELAEKADDNPNGSIVYEYYLKEIDDSDAFKRPSKEKPIDIYSVEIENRSDHGSWSKVHVSIVKKDGGVVFEYDRNYSFKNTFYPFRQGDRNFALISPNYTATTVVDLDKGEIIAGEEPDGMGFCPVGFYVPDWWDVNYEFRIPGSSYWNDKYEEPSGKYGFVWGCHWGDDNSWKVQYLDLSDIQNGNITREERFDYRSIFAFDPDPSKFIEVDENGSVTFIVPARYSLDGTKLEDY